MSYQSRYLAYSFANAKGYARACILIFFLVQTYSQKNLFVLRKDKKTNVLVTWRVMWVIWVMPNTIWQEQEIKIHARACVLFPFVQKDIPKTCILWIGNQTARHILCNLKSDVSYLSDTKSKGSNMTGDKI